jgi:hypothetical protein
MRNRTDEERILRKRIRFLLPNWIAFYCMVGFAAEASDFYATHFWAGISWVSVLELALLYNILIRRKLTVKLERLLAGKCVVCGYDLRVTPDRCPECGTIPPKGDE